MLLLSSFLICKSQGKFDDGKYNWRMNPLEKVDKDILLSVSPKERGVQ